MESEEGPNLLHDLGLETLGLEPSPTFVPHVLFNQVSKRIEKREREI